MIPLLLICIAIWLAKALVEIGIGFFQILAGIALGLLGAALYVLAHTLRIYKALWRMAFLGIE